MASEVPTDDDATEQTLREFLAGELDEKGVAAAEQRGWHVAVVLEDDEGVVHHSPAPDRGEQRSRLV